MKLVVEARVRRPSGFALEASIDVEAASVGIVGPSGAGKSTLLDVLAGAEAGRVVVDGEDWSTLSMESRRVGYVTQDALLFPHLNVRANLEFSPRARDVDAIADALGLRPLLDRMPRSLSGGERRRVALGRALASDPRLLILDEPFAGLDELRRREAMALLDDVRLRFRKPMVLVSHLPEEVVGLADVAIRMESGRVVATGPSASVLRAGETEVDNHFVAEVVGPGRVRVGGVELAAAVPGGAKVRIGCYARDVILATEMPKGLSARNVFWTTIASMAPAGDAVLVGLAAPPVRAVITREAAGALELAEGKRIVAIIKATSLAYLGAA